MGPKKLNVNQMGLPLPSGPTYCLDANALIDIYHAGLIKKLSPFIKTGCIRVAEGVYRELRRKSDKLNKILSNWVSSYGVLAELNEAEKIQFARVQNKYKDAFKLGNKDYPGLWLTMSGKKGIDSQVIALAKLRGWAVVSNDTSMKGACAIEGIECITWEEFSRRLRIIR